MINKIYKRIHNKYSTLFKFLFFLRHLFVIFFTSVVLFLSIPHFLDIQKNDIQINDYLLKNYGLTINKYENIKYNSLPKPNLVIQNVDITIEANSLRMNTDSLIIYPKLFNIYNYKNFKANKIIINKSKISLLDSNLKIFIDYIYNLKNKFTFKNLNLKISKEETPFINIKKLNFSNYGYDKNIVRGELFDKKFKIKISEEYDEINFKILKTGFDAQISFNEKKTESGISGIFKSKLLKSKFKFNFNLDEKKLRMFNSYFRNSNISFKSESIITYRPFFSSQSFFEIEDVNTKLLKYINLKKILGSKHLIKKINIQDEINFKSKNFDRNLINDLNLNINLRYGKLIYTKKISISDNIIICNGDINLLDEYPILYFECLIKINDKKKFLKKFSIKYKNKNETLKVTAKGNINILNNKINFKNILINQDYKAQKEDLNYFKQSFEKILFDKDFVNIFNIKKIKDFILEIS